MPVFHRPRTVIVSDDGGSGLAAVAGALVLLAVVSAVVSALAAILADLLFIVLAALLTLCAAGTVALVVILRRSGTGVAVGPIEGPPVPRRAVAQAIPLRRAQAISGPRPRVVIAGEVVSESGTRK